MDLKRIVLLAMKWKKNGAFHSPNCEMISWPICSCGVGELCAELPEYGELESAISEIERR